MIVYWKGFSGGKLLIQIHGSALCRSIGPGLLSVGLYYLFLYNTHFGIDLDEFGHPYAIGVLISSVVLILVFRANHGYQRYWEACGAVHLLMSKWLDVAVHMSVFHMQCKNLGDMRPVSMFEIEESNRRGDEDEEGLKKGTAKIGGSHGRVFSGDWSINEVFGSHDEDFPKNRTRAGTDPKRRSRHRNPLDDKKQPRFEFGIFEDGTDENEIEIEIPKPKAEARRRHRRLQSSPESNRDMFPSEDFALAIPGRPEVDLGGPPTVELPESKQKQRLQHRRLQSTPESNQDLFLNEVFAIGRPEEDEVRVRGRKQQHPFFRDAEVKEESILKEPRSVSGSKRGSLRSKLGYKRKISSMSNKDYDIMHDYQDTLRTTLPEVELGRVDGGWGLLFGNGEASYDLCITPTGSWASGVTPSLFLQELAHLSSLCVAVALCTLRDDWYDPIIPMEPYVPNSRTPFPDVDSSKLFFQQKHSLSHKLRIWMVYWFGMEMADDYIRTYFHKSIPMPVLGGVSEAERFLLAQARGGAAKTTLTWYWLSEFITREQMNGAAGNVGGPILSRIHQFLSDGMVGYSKARNISYIPFPFAHAQISVFFIPVLVVFIPLIMIQYTNTVWLGTSLVFFTVTIFTGVQEVACELENPFKNFPNDIPLKTLLVMYNEALIQMCTGFHPDMQWEEKKNK